MLKVGLHSTISNDIKFIAEFHVDNFFITFLKNRNLCISSQITQAVRDIFRYLRPID